MDQSVTDKPDDKKLETGQSPDFAAYPKLDSIDLGPPPPSSPPPPPPPTVTPSNQDNSALEPPQPEAESLKTKSQSKSVTWSSDLTSEAPYSKSETPATTMPTESNPYVSTASPSPAHSSSSFNVKNTVSTVKDVLGRWGKKVGETSKKGQDLAGNVWQHLKTGPSFADAAMGRIAQGTKVLAEGGYEKIFQQTFETIPEEKLQRTYACYLSTSAGPVMGILYISTAKLAFCSDNPLPYKAGEQDEWSYYKVVIPLHQLKAVNTSTSKVNRAEKYIQIVSVDNHEFWFMGFVNYDSAVKYLQDAVEVHNLQSG